jgi:tetratricopeptide (TPR) repeat protein
MRRIAALGLLSLVFLLGFSAAAAPVHASSAHEAGIEAFEEGNYDKALQHFLQAEAEGVRTPNLRYNLGVTYYRLGRYKEAEKAFRVLAEHPDWRHLALYNLGMVAEAREDREAAVEHYSRVRDIAGGSGVARRAARKLRELGAEEAEPEVEADSGPGFARVSVAAGYDDNAVLAPEEGTQDISEEGDAFAELYGLASVYVSGDRSDGIRLDADVFTRRYASESEYSFTSLSGGVSRHKDYETWQTSLGLSTAAELAESDLYAVVPALRLQGERRLDHFRLKLSNELSWIEGSSDYDYLNGVQNQLTARLERRMPGGKTYLGIGAEYNDRNDLSLQDRFFSYSPFRRSVHAGLDYLVAPRCTLVLYGEYRTSIYADENRMEVDGSLVEDEREDDRILLSVRGEYDFTPNIAGFAEYSHTDNDSSFARYSYQSNQVLVGLRRVF